MTLAQRRTAGAKACINAGACFEARSASAPQHEVIVLMARRNVLTLRRPRSGRLEGRTFFDPGSCLRGLRSLRGGPLTRLCSEALVGNG